MNKSTRYNIQKTFPQIREAGITSGPRNDTVSNCLRHEKENNTLEKIKKFRKTNLLEVGTTTLHFGNYDDVKAMDKNVVHGKKTAKSDKVEEVIVNHTEIGFEKHIQHHKEQLYHSEKTKPHAQSLSRNYCFPEVVNDPNFQFGVKTLESKFKRQKV